MEIKIPSKIPKVIRKKILKEFHGDECEDITKNGKRCKFATKYRHKLTGQTKDCSEYCTQYLTEKCEFEILDLIDRLLYGSIEYKEGKEEPTFWGFSINVGDETLLSYSMAGYSAVWYDIFKMYLSSDKIIRRNLEYDMISDGNGVITTNKKSDKKSNDEIEEEFKTKLPQFIQYFCKLSPQEFQICIELDFKKDSPDHISVGNIKGFLRKTNIRYDTQGEIYCKKISKNSCVIL